MAEKIVLHDFEIDEISAVDKPAQEHARATIMKRNHEEPTTMESFTELVEKVRLQKNCSATEAMTIVRKRHPNAYQKHQFDGLKAQREIKKAEDNSETARYRAAFDQAVETLAATGMKRDAAMTQIRKLNPELCKAAFA